MNSLIISLVIILSSPLAMAQTCRDHFKLATAVRLAPAPAAGLTEFPGYSGYFVSHRLLNHLSGNLPTDWINQSPDNIKKHLGEEHYKWVLANPKIPPHNNPGIYTSRLTYWMLGTIEHLKNTISKIRDNEKQPIDWLSVTSTEKEIIQYYSTENLNLHKRIRIASITKTVTALGIFHIYEKLGLELLHDPQHLSQVLAHYGIQVPPEMNELTIHRLLTHNAGLQKGTGINSWMDPRVHSSGEFPALETILAKIRQRGLGHYKTVGVEASSNYSNLGYDLLGLVIAYHSNKSGDPEAVYQKYILNEILKPLGMHESGFNIPDSEKSLQLVGLGAKDKNGNRSPMPVILRPRGESASAGLYSTPFDMIRLGQFFLTTLQSGPDQSGSFLKYGTLIKMFQRNSGHHGISNDFFMRPASGLLTIGGLGMLPTTIFHAGSFLGSESLFVINVITGQVIFTFLNANSPKYTHDLYDYVNGLNAIHVEGFNRDFRSFEWKFDYEEFKSKTENKTDYIYSLKPAPTLTGSEAEKFQFLNGKYFSPSFGWISVRVNEIVPGSFIISLEDGRSLLPVPSHNPQVSKFRIFHRKFWTNNKTQAPYHSMVGQNGELVEFEMQARSNGTFGPKALIIGETFRYQYQE